ncbi:caspase family protein [Microcystis panniformis]|uniref:Peptidase C14 caspase catalytic subunit p20 n=1 Tax=Microcystis panniformis FACHB-1757 TaxID=1638788 RepID=A0A0K1S3A6_9CHRO|nr:caspase family protein [Microcystis panniformis]AKV68498.1 hypothetical protein VL20_3495 [Microcystis panniformis FACHB-1757]
MDPVTFCVGTVIIGVTSIALQQWLLSSGDKRVSTENSPPTKEPPKPTRSPQVFVLQVLHAVQNDPVADELQADKELFWKLFSNSVVLRGRKVQRFEESTKLGTLGKLDELSRLAESGDTVLISISSHGTRIKSTEEPDGIAEYMVLEDTNLSDRDFTTRLAKLQLGVRAYVFASSCHGGGFLNVWQPLEWKANVMSFGVNEEFKNIVIPGTMPYSLLGKCFSQVLKKIETNREILSNKEIFNRVKDIADQLSIHAGPGYSDVTIQMAIVTSSIPEQQDFLNAPFLSERVINTQSNLPEVTGISWNPPNPVYTNTAMTISWKSVDKAVEYDVIVLRDDTTQILHQVVNSNSLNYSLQGADMFHSLTVKISGRCIIEI